jgi:hypothetical protein
MIRKIYYFVTPDGSLQAYCEILPVLLFVETLHPLFFHFLNKSISCLIGCWSES